MKNIIKSIGFVLGLALILTVLTFILLPGEKAPEYGVFYVSKYEILGERPNTIDVIAVGDSLVYSSFSPMEIWNDYGFTSFDSAEPAQVISSTYKNIELAIKNQHPKVILLEANIIFRDPKNQDKYTRFYRKNKDFNPLGQHHNNWKNYMTYGKKDNWINIYKGFKYITKTEPSKNKKYMKPSNEVRPIAKENSEYFNKIVDLCEKNNTKLVLISFPTQTTWSYKKHNAIAKIAKEKNLEFIDLNLIDLKIDWEKDTKDKGSHLNYRGALKVTKFVGNYLKELDLLKDKRNDPEYDSWNKAYEMYKKTA